MPRIRTLHREAFTWEAWEAVWESGSPGMAGKERMGIIMEANAFGFRIINLADGTQVIDTTLKTPYDALTPLQMVEYTEMDVQLALMDRMRRKQRREAVRQRKLPKDLLHRFAYLLGTA